MSVTEKLVVAVETFSNAAAGAKFSFLLIFLACFLQSLSFGTNGWTTHQETTQGLWTYCDSSTQYTCCQTIETYLSKINNNVPAWLQATRTFQGIGLVSSIVALVLIVLCTLVKPTSSKRAVRIATVVTTLVAAVSIFIGVCIYGGRYRLEDWLKDSFLYWSFGFSVTAGILFLICGAILFFSPESNTVIVAPQQQSSVPPVEPTAPPLEPTAPPLMPSGNNQPQHTPQDGQETCCICMDNPPIVVFMPCQHQTCCSTCAASVTECPMCRRNITQRITPYR